MALNKTVMAGLIADNIIAANPSGGDKPDLLAYWEPICQGLIDHMTSDGEVLPGTFVDGTSAPVTGKGEIS